MQLGFDLPIVASGTASGQPVACVDAWSVDHGASSMHATLDAMAGVLEEVQVDYFDRRGGDPSSIVAVVTRPPSPDADFGLLFVAADGVLNGCGEATMGACEAMSIGRANRVTFATTGGPIVGTGKGSGAVALSMPPVGEPSQSHAVLVDGAALNLRTLSVAGNRFAIVAASDVGLDFDDVPLPWLGGFGDGLRSAIAAALAEQAGEPAPGLLLLTEPVVDGRTRSATIWGNAILNRGPCGTGTCARLIVAIEDDEITAGAVLRHRSPFGHEFTARLDAARGDDPNLVPIVLEGRVDLDRSRKS